MHVFYTWLLWLLHRPSSTNLAAKHCEKPTRTYAMFNRVILKLNQVTDSFQEIVSQKNMYLCFIKKEHLFFHLNELVQAK